MRKGWGLALLWLLVLPAVAWLKSLHGTAVITERNLLLCAPALYLLVARAAMVLPLPQPARVAAGAGLVLASFVGFLGSGSYTEPHRQQFRELVQQVIDSGDRAKNAVIISTQPPAYVDYYFERLGSELRVDLGARGDDADAEVRRRIRTETPQKIWLLRGRSKADVAISREIDEKGYKRVSTAEFYGGLFADFFRQEWEEEAASPDAESPVGGLPVEEGAKGGRQRRRELKAAADGPP